MIHTDKTITVMKNNEMGKRPEISPRKPNGPPTYRTGKHTRVTAY